MVVYYINIKLGVLAVGEVTDHIEFIPGVAVTLIPYHAPNQVRCEINYIMGFIFTQYNNFSHYLSCN